MGVDQKRSRRERRAAAVETVEPTEAIEPTETVEAPEEAPAADSPETEAPAPRKGGATVVLARGVKNTLPEGKTVRSSRGRQRHALAKGETRTLCGIDTTGWSETVDEGDETVTCPFCADALKKLAAEAA